MKMFWFGMKYRPLFKTSSLNFLKILSVKKAGKHYFCIFFIFPIALPPPDGFLLKPEILSRLNTVISAPSYSYFCNKFICSKICLKKKLQKST